MAEPSPWPARVNFTLMGLAVAAFIVIAGQRLLSGPSGTAPVTSAVAATIIDRVPTLDPGLAMPDDGAGEASSDVAEVASGDAPVPPSLDTLFGSAVQFVAAGEDGLIVTRDDDSFRVGDTLQDGSELIAITLDQLIISSSEVWIEVALSLDNASM